jgi:hypothetical protein
MPEPAPKKQPKREFESASDAAEALEKKRRRAGNPIQEVAYRGKDGISIADERETVSLERAADDRKEMLDQRKMMADAVNTFDAQDKIDAHRLENADVIAAGPSTGEPNHPQLEQDPAADQFESDAVANGVNPELAKVLAHHPQARQALESEFEKVGKLQQQHETQIQIAQHFARDQWLSQFPELARFPLDRIAPELVKLHQTNPARAKAAMASLQRVGDMAALSEHNQAQRAHAERQQFQADAARQDAAFERSIGHQTPQQRAAIASEVVSYAAEMGINFATLQHLFQTSPIMRHAAMQRVFYDAATARAAKREGMKYRDKMDRTVPNVSRPGHTNSPRTSRGQENLQALRNKANSTGSLKDMAKLLTEMRRGR